jgi:hypothetical protein
MRKSKLTETQIVSILKYVDAGMRVSELGGNHGVSVGQALRVEVEVCSWSRFGATYNWTAGVPGVRFS